MIFPKNINKIFLGFFVYMKKNRYLCNKYKKDNNNGKRHYIKDP